mmetsp:Transcript_52488/g.139753  ORF Transcript_52488/g.139753 Transcript_52488/m.139753 type:complete len:468 (-) Transcript_52488:157-1560(-)
MQSEILHVLDGLSVPCEGALSWSASGHVVKHDASGEDVPSRRPKSSLPDLWRDVPWCAASVGHPVELVHETKIDDDHLRRVPILGARDHDIGFLQVGVNHKIAVQELYSEQDLLEDPRQPPLSDVDPSGPCMVQCCGEIATIVGLLHHVDVGSVLENIENTRYLWVTQRHQHLELLSDFLDGNIVVQFAVRLQHHLIIRLLVLRLEDRALPALAQHVAELVPVPKTPMLDTMSQLDHTMSRRACRVPVLSQAEKGSPDSLILEESSLARELESPEDLVRLTEHSWSHPELLGKHMDDGLHILQLYARAGIHLARSGQLVKTLPHLHLQLQWAIQKLPQSVLKVCGPRHVPGLLDVVEAVPHIPLGQWGCLRHGHSETTSALFMEEEFQFHRFSVEGPSDASLRYTQVRLSAHEVRPPGIVAEQSKFEQLAAVQVTGKLLVLPCQRQIVLTCDDGSGHNLLLVILPNA